MPNGSLSLNEFPHPVVELACTKCGRRGRLHKARLVKEYGGDIALPDLRRKIARCDRAGSMSDVCGVHYAALAVTPKK